MWVPIEKIVEVIEQSRAKKWLWPLNWDCKYIVLRIDMRDGHCVIMDRNQKPITLAELQRQRSIDKPTGGNK
jgi:hypothetical protein